MQVHIVRNCGFGHAVRESRFDCAGWDLQTTNPCTVACEQRPQGETGCSDCRVAGEGELGVYHEDAGAPCWYSLVLFGAGIIVQVQESGFGEVELASDGLKGFGRGVLACWDED
jgi:hypothetical protein